MPAFYGDGYGAVQLLFGSDFFQHFAGTTFEFLALLAFLCVIKIVGTCVTLGSGGSGGVIAPCVFIGATAGSIVGFLLRHWFPSAGIQPELYALVGMGAVLAAVVHAPLASILICFELTQDYKVMLPAMLACIISTGVARALYRDSIYTAGLRARGVRLGDKSDLTLLRRMTVEQVDLEPAVIVHTTEPLRRAIDLSESTEAPDIVVTDKEGRYKGMISADDIKAALLASEAIPLLLAEEMMRVDVPMVRSTDDLATVLDTFTRCDVGRLPVNMKSAPDRVIGLISRAGLMRRYQHGLDEPT
jgi:CIC family chloride channel protein